MKRLIMQAQNNYDVIIVGSGVGGSILAAHIAEKGVNPKNGERLRIAMLEAGPYWKGEPQPGYGVPLRRQAIANVFSDDASERMWPWGMVKMVGGSTMHYGASVYLPYSVDYKHWVDEGTDWTEETCREAAAEVEKMFNIHTEPDEMLSKGCLMFRETARALGREVHPAQVARRNCLYCGFCEGGYFCRYDSKMNAMTTYIPLAEKRGVEIIPNATVERVIIEKNGARPVATGVVFQQAGKSVQFRASKIIVSGGVIGTPRLLFMSGYGPKEELGGKLIVENSNIGKHLDIHAAIIVQAYFDQPVKDGSRGAAPAGFFLLDDAGPNAYGRLRIKDSGMIGIDEPWSLAFSPFAPNFGREHKQFMKQARMHRGGALVVLKKPEGYRGRINLQHRRWSIPVTK